MQNLNLVCHCGSSNSYLECCQPLISDSIKPKTAEQLMRSRFSAFKLREHQYILDTQSLSNQPAMSVSDFDSNIQWLGLYVLSHQQNNHSLPISAEVEFVAFFKASEDGFFKQLHEISYFERPDDQWLYISGTQQSDIKIPRNNPCFCNSGKKYKKCHALQTV